MKKSIWDTMSVEMIAEIRRDADEYDRKLKLFNKKPMRCCKGGCGEDCIINLRNFI